MATVAVCSVASSAAVLPGPLPARTAGSSAPGREVVAASPHRKDETSLNNTGDFGNEQGVRLASLHPLLRIPASLLLPHINNLSDVIRIVRADMSNIGVPIFQLALIGVLDGFLPVSHNFV